MLTQQPSSILDRLTELDSEFTELFEPSKAVMDLGLVQVREKFPEVIYSNKPTLMGSALFVERLIERSHLSSWDRDYFNTEIELARAVSTPGLPVFNESLVFIDPLNLSDPKSVPLYLYASDDKGPCAVLQANAIVDEREDGSALVDLNVAGLMVSADRRQQGIAKELIHSLICDFIWKLDDATMTAETERVSLRVNVKQDTRAGQLVFEILMAWLIEELELQPHAYPGGVGFHTQLSECPLIIINSDLPLKTILGLSEE